MVDRNPKKKDMGNLQVKLLSIVVPSYNVEKTLARTLDSICVNEVLDDLDVMVVDDGSADGTAEIGRQYAERYSETVRVIKKENGGHGSTINIGIDAAKGVFFKVVDGDDTLAKEGLIKLVDSLRSTRADLIVANYEKVVFEKDEPPTLMRCEGFILDRLYTFDQLPEKANIYFGIHSMVIRTALLKDNGIRLQEHTFYVDTEFGLLPIPFVQTVAFLDCVVYRYTVGNAQQSIDPQQFVKRYEDHDRVVKRMTAYVQTCSCDAAHKKYMYSVLRKLCFTQYMLSAFYDSDTKRGQTRSIAFDKWLFDTDPDLYKALSKSLYIRVQRILKFRGIPKNRAFKSIVKNIYYFAKPLFRKKRKLTY